MAIRRTLLILQSLLSLVLLYLGAATCWNQTGPSVGTARLIKVPLTRGHSQASGSLGQPVLTYYSQLALGTPGKLFNVQFDVGLSESFVPHYEWSPFKTNLHYGKGYRCKDSSSCTKYDSPIQIQYQNCKLTGKKYEDHIKITDSRTGPNSQVYPVAIRQGFLAVSDASDARFKDLPVDGYFGLGPVSQSGHTPSLVGTLHEAGFIDNLQFSFWFNPLLDSVQGGELVLGGVDVARYTGNIYWHPVTALLSNQWLIGLQHVNLGNQVVSSCSSTGPYKCQAAISSSANEILGPKSDVQRIYSLLNTTRNVATGLELIDCRRIGQLPILTFLIDGIPYALLPSNYVRKTTSGTIFKTETCYVAILAETDSSRNHQWTLGTNFLGAYYSVYDMTYRQVGFASLR